MEFKYIKPLVVASIINVCLGAFLFICGILEFTNILPTPANNSIRTVGVQLSYLVFISGVFLLASGGITFLNRKTMRFVNLQIFAGVTTLAWPIFVSIALFFTTIPHTINIRLIPSTMEALFYIISLFIVKITNETLSKTHRINTQMLQTGKRKVGVNVANVLNNAGGDTKKASVNIKALGGVVQGFKTKNAAQIGSKIFISGKRRSSGNPLKRLFSGQRRHSGGGLAKRLYSGKRRRRR